MPIEYFNVLNFTDRLQTHGLLAPSIRLNEVAVLIIIKPITFSCTIVSYNDNVDIDGLMWQIRLDTWITKIGKYEKGYLFSYS